MSDPKKKILVLFGSPHKEGFTRQLAESFLAPFRDSGEWEVEEWDAYERQARPCLGCGACQKAEACALHDLDGWDRALRDSDFLAVAAPVYNASFPAPVKAMLDRTQRYFEARFALGKKPSIAKHREAALLLTMGSEDEFALEVCSHQLGRAFSVMNTSLTGQAVWAATDRPEEHRAQALARARELGESCARSQPGKEGPRPLELRQVREESPEFPRVVELYREAFPQGERSSLVPLLEDETGGGEILSLWDGEVFAGMACLLRTQRLAHLIYFAVAPELRDRGLGSRALAAFRRRYPETPLGGGHRAALGGGEEQRPAKAPEGLLPAGGVPGDPGALLVAGGALRAALHRQPEQRDWRPSEDHPPGKPPALGILSPAGLAISGKAW